MNITRRNLLLSTSALALALGMKASPAMALIVSTEEAMKEVIEGDPNAKVEVIEYASLACPACKFFHEEIYPELKAKFIETGKIRFIYRDFPTNSAALAAAMIARCAGPQRHAGMVDMFFTTQQQWGRSQQPLQALSQVARMGGIGPSEVDQCIRNSELMQSIQAGAKHANQEMGVTGTPTLFVAGKMSENGLKKEELFAKIEEAIADAS
jgi:protein-disulfide isomerase